MNEEESGLQDEPVLPGDVADESQPPDAAESLRLENRRLQKELDSLHEQLRMDRISQALQQRGAPEEALPLLMMAAREEDPDSDAAGLVWERYGRLLIRTEREGTPPLAPPGTGTVSAGALTQMTPDEINTCWDSVRGALSR